jgi:phosphoribosylformylglycinamidine cyclo-ligase
VNSSSTRGAWTYARAGVDTAEVGRALSELLRAVRYRPPPTSGRPIDRPGHYAGLVRVGRETLALTTDTVGTKVRLAERLGRWEEIGEDAVAINVNDLAAVGARPVGLVDTINCARPDADIFAALGRGIDRGLRRARCALLGGETAVVPELVTGLDLGATALGFFPRGRAPVLGTGVRPGDVVIGIPSSGLHANGLTLARRIVEEAGGEWDRPRPGAERALGEEMLTATRTYTDASEALAGRATTTGFAHITGGGIRNLARLNARVSFVLDDWPEPAGIFRWLADTGGIATEELYQTFNMGIGFVAVVRPVHLAETFRRLARSGAPDARAIGRVERGAGVRLPRLGLEYAGYR